MSVYLTDLFVLTKKMFVRHIPEPSVINGVLPQEKCVSSTATYWHVSQTAARVSTDPVIACRVG